MAIKIKAGTNFVLPITFEDANFGDISVIEFLFKQDKNGDTLKTAYWSADGSSRDAQRKEGENIILINFSRDDSYLFRQNAQFFMDTRIHYNESPTNPYTRIVPIMMNETLFRKGEEVVP